MGTEDEESPENGEGQEEGSSTPEDEESTEEESEEAEESSEEESESEEAEESSEEESESEEAEESSEEESESEEAEESSEEESESEEAEESSEESSSEESSGESSEGESSEGESSGESPPLSSGDDDDHTFVSRTAGGLDHVNTLVPGKFVIRLYDSSDVPMGGAAYRVFIDGVAGEVLTADKDGRTIVMDTSKVQKSIVVEWRGATEGKDSGPKTTFPYRQELSL